MTHQARVLPQQEIPTNLQKSGSSLVRLKTPELCGYSFQVSRLIAFQASLTTSEIFDIDSKGITSLLLSGP